MDADFKDMPKKKEPSVFLRPAVSSPADQLKHADRLLAQGKIREAGRQYRALVHTWHDSKEAAVAQMSYARLLDQAERYEHAFDEYQYLADNYAGQFDYDDTIARQFRIAWHVMTVRRGNFLFFRGRTSPGRALPLFEKIVQNAPHWRNTPQAQLCVGQIHEQVDEHQSAVTAYRIVQSRYPNSDCAEKASLGEGKSLYAIANDSPRDESAARNALSVLAGFLNRYPGSKDAGAAREHLDTLKERLAAMYYERAVFYDKISKRPESAIIAYNDLIKRFPSSEAAETAYERVRILERGQKQ